jgi:hypothetical protein
MLVNICIRRPLENTMLVYFVAIWNELTPFGTFYANFLTIGIYSPILVYCTKTNLLMLWCSSQHKLLSATQDD